MLREYLRFTEENQYGVYNVAPSPGTNQFVMRLDDSNAFTVRKATVPVRIMWGGGFAVPGYTFSDKMTVQGAYKGKLYYSQAGWLLPWGLMGLNSTRTLPWVSSEPVGDLPSMSIEHAYFYDDTANAFKRTMYLGCKVGSGRLEVSADSQVATLTLQIVGGTAQGEHFTPTADPSSTAFPPPLDSDYPPWDVVAFTDSCGNFQLGSVLTKYESLAFDWTNKIDARFFCAHFVQEARSLGRDLNLEANVKIDSTPDLRDQYERIEALTTKLMFTNGLKTITLDFKGNGILTKVDEDLQIDKIYMKECHALKSVRYHCRDRFFRGGYLTRPGVSGRLAASGSFPGVYRPQAGESRLLMALEVSPVGGDPSRTELDMDDDKPPVLEEMEPGQHGGSTSALIGEGLTLSASPYGPATTGLVGRLPESSKKMLGIGGAARNDHFA